MIALFALMELGAKASALSAREFLPCAEMEERSFTRCRGFRMTNERRSPGRIALQRRAGLCHDYFRGGAGTRGKRRGSPWKPRTSPSSSSSDGAVIELDGPSPHRVPVSRAKIAEVRARLGLVRRNA